jgi:hypothetical protein
MSEKKRKSQQSRSGEGDIQSFFKKRKLDSESGELDFLNAGVKEQGKATMTNGGASTEVADLGTSRGVTSVGVVANMTEEQRTVSWLRSLTNEEALKLHRVVIAGREITDKVQVPESDRVLVAGLRASPSCEGRDGAWYISWSTCKVVITKEKGISHPRAQVDLKNLGPRSLGTQIKKILSGQAWETLSSIGTLKIGYHVIAYNALPIREEAPIPLNLGSGGSISHPCDERGCLSHLEATPVHKDNMDRQRCPGIFLMVFHGTIVMEVPCAHGKERGQDLEVQLKKSCRKLRVQEISESCFELMKIL